MAKHWIIQVFYEPESEDPQEVDALARAAMRYLSEDTVAAHGVLVMTHGPISEEDYEDSVAHPPRIYERPSDTD